MTPERVARLVSRWVRLYTRGLPGPVAERRREEIDADLHDHLAHERTHGARERRIAMGVAARMLRGLAADVAWRRRMNPRRSFARVALVTALILLVPLVAMQFDAGVRWTLADFVFAGTILGVTGLVLEQMVGNPRRPVYRVASTAIALLAILLGYADDAPGLVLFGCVLIAGTIGLAVRTARRSG